MKRFILMCLGIATFVVLGIARASENNTQTTEIKPKEKRNVLILQIIEENWDNLEFTPPLYKIPSGYKHPTKREVMEGIYMNVTGTKEGILKGLNYRISLGKIPQNLKFYVVHTIKYFGKTDELKDNDILEESIYRFGKYSFGYYYSAIPEKIPLLTEPKFGDKKDISPLEFWSHFEYIRLVDDIIILFSDAFGNLKIKYDNKTYNLKVGNKIIFPVKEANLSTEEMINFKRKYKEERSRSSLESLSVKKNIFYFKTKVTIINDGYVEMEL